MSEEFLMKPKVDFAFKEIMMDEQARLGFLSAVLHIAPENIRETRILNTYLRKEHQDDKQGILDVRILLNDDTEIDIEVQIAEIKVWAERSLFYLAKMYAEQIKSGENYNKFKKCVSISVLDFKLFENAPDFYSCFHIREDTRHTLFTDKMEFHVIELPKLPDTMQEGGNSVLTWAKFINAERKEEFEVLSKQSPYLASAYKQLQTISQDEEKRMEYTARLKAQLDHNQIVWEAEERGEERGVKKGRSEGRADERIANIRNMVKNMGVSIEQAMSVLEVPEDEWQQYKDLLEQEIPRG